jgi:hypothetical protein
MARRLSGLVVALLVAMGLAVPVAANAAPTSSLTDTATALPCAAEARDLATASSMARRCGLSQVEALSERTERTQVFVSDSGRATMVSAAVPQRVRRSDGSWVGISTALQRHGDGVLAPTATLADIAFSGGGGGPLVTWREGARVFTLSWSYGPLPAPRVSGSEAIYESVLPDVNLHAIATVDGFLFTLEVRTRAAANHPAVRQTRYLTGGDLALVRDDSGGLSLLDPAGQAVAAVGEASMWDSTSGDATGTAHASASGAAPASRRAEAAVGLGRGELTVTADGTLFSDPRVVWPVYIDPPFNKLRSKWAYANSHNVNIISPVTAWVGRDPLDGKLFRSYFEFDVSTLRGTQILAAEVTMVLDHSWSCTNTPVYLFGTGSITVSSGTRMSWSTRPLPTSRYLDSWSGHANEAGGCGVIEPDADAVFEGTAVTNDVQARADASATTYTVGLCACDSNGDNETVQSRWKYFHPGQTYLIATYDLPPNTPTAQSFSTTTDCYLACSSPATVRTTQPTLKVRVSDTYGGVLRTNFEVRASASGTGTLIASTSSPISTSTSGGPPPFGFASWQVPSGKLVSGTTYYWRARSTDENNLVGPWLAFQTITVDTSAPATPTVTSSQYPALQWGATVGTQGSFTFSSAAADVADFTWWVDAGASATVTASGTNPRTATVTYTPATDMVHTLHVKAKDTAGNTSSTKDHQFWVSPLANRCWHWKLDETSGTTAAETGNTDPADPVCAPIGTVTHMNATVTANASGTVTFAAGYLNNAAWFAGTGGQIATAAAVLDTSKSFTVTAWVNPTDLSLGSQTAVSQDGTTSSRFTLGFVASANAGAGGWCFVTYGSDGGSTASACADGSMVGLPTEGTWVHLAGVFDAVTGQARMYVMGGLDTCGGETAVVASSGSWQAAGQFVMGRAKSAATGTQYWRGGLDGVHAYSRALQEADICQLALQ